MDKIIASRGCGKTTNLMYRANYFLKVNPQCSKIIFVCNNPDMMQDRYLKLFSNLERIYFINYSCYLDNLETYKNIKTFIDELEDFIRIMLNVEAYSLTI